ncbi:MAG: sigma-E processing peptidase SpoIIGA [Firmicutes bacterium]|nr:sigma-E processing peptidase SpoIIGA [Bacillota bacterium]
MTVYIDVIFILNFFMDMLIFYISGKFIGRVSTARLIISSLFGSLAYCILITENLSSIWAVIVMAVSAAICFKPKNIPKLIKAVLTANIVSFVIGGGAMALYYNTHLMPLAVLLISSCTAYITMKFILRKYKRITKKKQTIHNITIYKDGLKKELKALIDTGNSLYEPTKKLPVIIAEFNGIKELLPSSVTELFASGEENDLGKLVIAASQLKGFRLIPYSSLGKKHGMLIGFECDMTEIEEDGKKIIRKSVIGIYNGVLSEDGAYGALLNPELLA